MIISMINDSDEHIKEEHDCLDKQINSRILERFGWTRKSGHIDYGYKFYYHTNYPNYVVCINPRGMVKCSEYNDLISQIVNTYRQLLALLPNK